MQRAFLPAVVILVSCCALSARAQDLPSATAVRDAYERLNFDLALELATDVTANAESYTAQSLVEVHTIAALIMMSRGDRTAASSHFLSALSINPNLKLDPLSASPEVIEFFDALRSREKNDNPPPASVTRYIPVRDPRPAAAARSMLLPGWGQIHKGERTKGVIIMSVWGVAATGTLAAHLIRNNRHDRYVGETNPALVPDRFDDFNKWHRLRNNLALASAVVWSISYLDALLFSGEPSARRRSGRMSLDVNFGTTAVANGPGMTLRIPLGGRVQKMRTP